MIQPRPRESAEECTGHQAFCSYEQTMLHTANMVLPSSGTSALAWPASFHVCCRLTMRFCEGTTPANATTKSTTLPDQCYFTRTSRPRLGDDIVPVFETEAFTRSAPSPTFTSDESSTMALSSSNNALQLHLRCNRQRSIAYQCIVMPARGVVGVTERIAFTMLCWNYGGL
jgi:hypothetical protein